ncbi:MAG: hypothetical protein ABIH47_08835 [Candidatus Omnitrophota bacterium]
MHKDKNKIPEVTTKGQSTETMIKQLLHKNVEKINRMALLKIDKLKMRRLIDRWSPTVVILFLFVKGLQFFKTMGLKGKENGWRKATRAYFRTEHSKFSLTVFKLDVWSDLRKKENKNFAEAKRHLVERLMLFFREVRTVHWKLHWSRFSARREKRGIVDIVNCEFNDDGSIRHIETFFDTQGEPMYYLAPDFIARINDNIVSMYNQTQQVRDRIRPWVLEYKILKWLVSQKMSSKKIVGAGIRYVARVLSATFIHFEVLPAQCSPFDTRRFEDPDFIKRKHPGFGLLNILCRFNADYDEADLWFQIHHIPVDGVPMQEALQELKNQWGVRGDLTFPSLSQKRSVVPKLCSTEKGEKGMYHAREFIDFRSFLKKRKELNERYATQLFEDITVISMLIWGLAHHPVFHDRKFIFPIDLAASSDKERVPGFVIIRPSMYVNKDDTLKGFLAFQREFNRRLQSTKARQGESYELLEACALTSPLVYGITKKLMPAAVAEFFGTIGITIIKDADMFIAPFSDTHTDGFLAFGNFTVPTEDGGLAGAVSVRGPQEKVEDYLKAVREVISDWGGKYFKE